MKKRLTVLAAAVTLAIFSVIFSFISVAANNQNAPLILREYNGCAALYKGNEIIEIYDEIVISVLPQADKEMLASGIVIKNEEQLNSIIEDYDG